MGRTLGLFRAVYLVAISCMGSFAFAYDTGVISTSSLINFGLNVHNTALMLTSSRRCSHPRIIPKGLWLHSGPEDYCQLKLRFYSPRWRILRLFLDLAPHILAWPTGGTHY